MSVRNLTILLAAGFAVTACGGGSGFSSRGVESVHQPVVSRSDYVLDVYGGPDGLSPSDEGRVRGWFDSLQLGYGDRVSVDTSSYGNEETRRSIGQIAARYGLLLQDGAPATRGEIAPGAVRVIISRLKASVPSCPDWSHTGSSNFGNKSTSNYGCAMNSNLAAMVADPEDLVRGKSGDTDVDAAVSSKAIRAYREAEPTGKGGLKAEKAGGGQ